MTTIPTPQPTQPAVVHPLRVRDFRLLWMGATVSMLGDQFYIVALPWLVLQLTGSGLALGTVMMSAAIPRAVFMLMGGAVTDRSSPRRILIATASARTVLVGAVGALVQVSLPAMFFASGALVLAVAIVAGATGGLKTIK
jgi:MFS family permease